MGEIGYLCTSVVPPKTNVTMKKRDIILIIRERLGISELNGMQRAVIDCGEPNVMLHSPTGSGKTVAFASLMLLRIDPKPLTAAAVIVAPSRELASQIADVVRKIATGIKVVTLYGGHSAETERRQLSAGAQIIVATPGRLIDHVNRRNIDITTAQAVILDEYDKSLELGFHQEMKRIVALTRAARTMILTSATAIGQMPDFVGRRHFSVVDFSADNAEVERRIDVAEVESPVADKVDTAIDLLRSLDNGKVIIFVNHRESAERVFARLKKEKFPVGLYHGALDQPDREKALALFDNGTTPVLVATDLASRGLDIDSVAAVVHYHMPINEETWRHRNGRTARVDATGCVYVIRSENDNMPEFIRPSRQFYPSKPSAHPIAATVSTLYINAGRRDKISRGDVVGFLCQKGGLTAQEIGKITVADSHILVAVPAGKAAEVIALASPHRLKNHRVRLTILQP